MAERGAAATRRGKGQPLYTMNQNKGYARSTCTEWMEKRGEKKWTNFGPGLITFD